MGGAAALFLLALLFDAGWILLCGLLLGGGFWGWRMARDLSERLAALEHKLDGIHETLEALPRTAPPAPPPPSVPIPPSASAAPLPQGEIEELSTRIDELGAGVAALLQRALTDQKALYALITRADTAPQTAAAPQADLPLGDKTTPPATARWPEMVRALDFPQNAADKDGFAALRRYRPHPHVGPVLRAVEDLLTALAQDCIYMDDLPAQAADADLWRRFADGARGEEMATAMRAGDAALRGKLQERMRADPVFKDTVLHFLRSFDRFLSRFIDSAQDADLIALADTRTGRAFALAGAASGAFA